MVYFLNDHDMQALILMHKPGTRYFLDNQDPYTITDEKSMRSGESSFSIDLNPLILNYMKRYAMCSKNTKLVKASEKEDIEAFYAEIEFNKDERVSYDKFLSEYLIPTYEFCSKLSYFEVTDLFIQNYLQKKVSKENFMAHLSTIVSKFTDEDFHILFDYKFMPDDLYPIFEELYENKEYKLFAGFVKACIMSDFITYEKYKNQLAIAEYCLREPFLLDKKNENSVKYHFEILGEFKVVNGRIRAKFKKYIKEDVFSDYIIKDEPFRFHIEFPNPKDYKKCVQFLKDNQTFFNELKAYKKGLFEVIMVKTITYFPQHKIKDEYIDDELLKLGVKLRIDYQLGD